jgi:hypothetical protein
VLKSQEVSYQPEAQAERNQGFRMKTSHGNMMIAFLSIRTSIPTDMIVLHREKDPRLNANHQDEGGILVVGI